MTSGLFLSERASVPSAIEIPLYALSKWPLSAIRFSDIFTDNIFDE